MTQTFDELFKEYLEERMQEVEHEMRRKVERDLKQKVEREMKQKAEREMRRKIEREMRRKAEREMKRKIEREVAELSRVGFAENLIRSGKLSFTEISEYSGLSFDRVRELAEKKTLQNQSGKV